MDPIRRPAPAKRGFNVRLDRKTLLAAGAGVVLVVMAYFVWRLVDTQRQLNNLKTQQNSKQEVNQLVDKIGRAVILPTDETPTVATVNDATKLKDQAFFGDAQNGDKVIIYAQAKKAILYRPSASKIVNMAPLDLNNQVK